MNPTEGKCNKPAAFIMTGFGGESTRVCIAHAEWGQTIAEAMASGLPIVSTTVRGLSEIVSDGQNGFLVEPENPAQLAEKILLTLNSDVLREELSANNRTWAEQHTWEKVVERLEEVYSEVA